MYGHGIYISKWREFDPGDTTSGLLELRLRMNDSINVRRFEGSNNDDDVILRRYLSGRDLKYGTGNSVNDKAIMEHFTNQGYTGISFRESLYEQDEFVYEAEEKPTMTYIVYDPGVIYIVKVLRAF